MLKLNCRTVLAAAAAGLVVRAVPAFAASPYTFKHGALEVMVVSDGYLLLPTSFLAHGAPPADREAILKAAGKTGDQYQSPTNITLVRSERDLILIDMGSGDRFMPSAGRLWDNLKAAGIDQAKITKVVFTHGHPDHLWGTVDELDEWSRRAQASLWRGPSGNSGMARMRPADLPAERAGFVTGARHNYAAIKNKVVVVNADDEIVAGLRVIDTPGHTQGHVSLELAGGDGVIIGGDVPDPPADFLPAS
jgi:glyoxylase-like metal-dependent hydrolase (beta-lactamase superfamily II)